MDPLSPWTFPTNMIRPLCVQRDSDEKSNYDGPLDIYPPPPLSSPPSLNVCSVPLETQFSADQPVTELAVFVRGG